MLKEIEKNENNIDLNEVIRMIDANGLSPFYRNEFLKNTTPMGTCMIDGQERYLYSKDALVDYILKVQEDNKKKKPKTQAGHLFHCFFNENTTAMIRQIAEDRNVTPGMVIEGIVYKQMQKIYDKILDEV